MQFGGVQVTDALSFRGDKISESAFSRVLTTKTNIYRDQGTSGGDMTVAFLLQGDSLCRVISYPPKQDMKDSSGGFLVFFFFDDLIKHLSQREQTLRFDTYGFFFF